MLSYKYSGFTLIEVLITLAIVGILAAIATPMYNDYVVRSRIPQSTNNLTTARVMMEQYFQDNRSYGGPLSPCNNGTFTALNNSDFTYACTPIVPAVILPATTAYVIVATGVGRMAGFVFNINELNVRTTVSLSPALLAKGWALPVPNTCWVTKKGGVC